MTAAGCDTVAEITFHNEQLVEVAVQGVVSSRCSSAEGADFALRMTILTSRDRRLEPGMRFSDMQAPIVPGENFVADNILFSDGWLFAVDADGQDRTCASASDCRERESCLPLAGLGLDDYYYAPAQYCVIPTTISLLSAPRFHHYRELTLSENSSVTSDNANGRTIAFILDNSSSLNGSQLDGVPNDMLATDPYQYRRVGLTAFLEALSVSQVQSPLYEFSAHFANGAGMGGVFVPSETWIKTIGQFKAQILDKYPTPSGLSPIYEAALMSLEHAMQHGNAAYTRTLVAFTDGPPSSDTSLAAFQSMLGASGQTPLHWIDLQPDGHPPYLSYAARVAQQCGSYHYIHQPTQIPPIMRRIALNTESYWDIAISLSTKPMAGQGYRLATDFTIRLGDMAVHYAAQRKLSNHAVEDDRLFILLP